MQVLLGNGENTLNLCASKLGTVPGDQVIFKKQAVFDGQNGKNAKYVNVTGAPQFKKV